MTNDQVVFLETLIDRRAKGVIHNVSALLASERAYMGARMDDMDNRIEGLEDRLSGLEARLDNLETLSKSHFDLTSKIIELLNQRYSGGERDDA